MKGSTQILALKFLLDKKEINSFYNNEYDPQYDDVFELNEIITEIEKMISNSSTDETMIVYSNIQKLKDRRIYLTIIKNM